MRGAREVEQVRFALQGEKIQGAELFLIRDGLIDQDGALWRYVIELGCSIPAIPKPPGRPTPFITDFSKSEGA